MLRAREVALKYKELRVVNQAFVMPGCCSKPGRFVSQRDEAIRGHLFRGFLALVLEEELYRRIEASGNNSI